MDSKTIITTLGWWIKTISHMALEDLFIHIKISSMMDNSKMGNSMDICDGLIKMVAVMNLNGKIIFWYQNLKNDLYINEFFYRIFILLLF